MKNIRCSSCGAYLKLEDGQKTTVCPYCDTQYIDEEKSLTPKQDKPIQVINNYYNTTTTPTQGEKTAKIYIPPKPKINIIALILLFCLYIWPGLIYLTVKTIQIVKWNKNYASLVKAKPITKKSLLKRIISTIIIVLIITCICLITFI